MPRRSKTVTRDTHGLPLIGAQLSTAGGWDRVSERADATEAEVVQVFSSNPRIWPTTPPDDEALTRLRSALESAQRPLFIHAIYLINPASPDQAQRGRSVEALAHALVTGALAGAGGVVTHLGSHRGEGFDQAAHWIVETLEDAWTEARRDLATAPDRPGSLPPLLLETAAGSGATVGATFAELQTLVELLDHRATGVGSPAVTDPPTVTDPPRAGLCLDTAHIFAAGYAVHEPRGLVELVADLERRDLLSRVGLIHLNDSASLLGSKRDRHANPGEGELGYNGLADVVRHPAFAHIPFVLEVPGSEGHGPGAAEIRTVKRMRQAGPSLPAQPDGPGKGPTASE